MGRRQLSQLEISPYQEGLLARGIHHQHQGQIPNGQMEQAMGYTGAVGTMLMDEIARVCGQAEERFTSIWMVSCPHFLHPAFFPLSAFAGSPSSPFSVRNAAPGKS